MSPVTGFLHSGADGSLRAKASGRGFGGSYASATVAGPGQDEGGMAVRGAISPAGAASLAGLVGLSGLASVLTGRPLVALAAIPAAIAAMWLLLHPFAGIAILTAFSQLDGFALILSKALPLSAFKLLTALTLLAIIIEAARRGLWSGRPRPSPVVTLSLCFACWLIVSYLMSDYRAEGRAHLIGFLSTILLVPMVALTATTYRRVRLLVLIVALSGAVSAALVILETLTGIRIIPHADPADIAAWRGQIRSAGASAYNPTTAAHMVTASSFIWIVLALEGRHRRGLCAALALLCVVALAMMAARSAILAFGLTGLVLAWRYRRHRLFPLGVALGLMLSVAALPFVPQTTAQRFMAVFEGANTSDRTLLRRMSYNLIGLEQVARHPVAGIGPGAYPTVYASHEYRWYPGREQDRRQLHNSYMEVAAETGLVGLALFVAVLLAGFRAALRTARSSDGAAPARGLRDATGGDPQRAALARGLCYGFGAFLVASLFMPNEDTKYMWLLAILSGQLALTSSRQPRPDPARPGAQTDPRRLLAAPTAHGATATGGPGHPPKGAAG